MLEAIRTGEMSLPVVNFWTFSAFLMLFFPIRSEMKKSDVLVFAKQLVATMLARGLLEEKVVPNAVSLCLSLHDVQ
jgi:hypothetical protein